MLTKSSKHWQVRISKLGGLLLVLLSIGTTPALLGQTAATGALTGTLKDSSGAVVPNATVTATSIGTGQARTASTDAAEPTSLDSFRLAVTG